MLGRKGRKVRICIGRLLSPFVIRHSLESHVAQQKAFEEIYPALSAWARPAPP